MRRFGFHHFGRGRALGLVALIGSVVSLAVLGALPVEAGTASTAPKPEAPGTGAPLLLPADVGSSITPPAGLYPAKPQPQTKECRCTSQLASDRATP